MFFPSAQLRSPSNDDTTPSGVRGKYEQEDCETFNSVLGELLIPIGVVSVQQQIVVAPPEKVRPYVSISTPHQPYYYAPQQKVYHKAHMHNLGGVSEVGLLDGTYASSVAFSGHPHIYRSAGLGQQPQFAQTFLRSRNNYQDGPASYGMNEFMQSNKVPREIDSNQLSPIDEGKQQDGTAMLIDGRRSPRSNKEEKKQPTEKPEKN